MIYPALIVNQRNISHELVRSILVCILGMKCVAARLVTKLNYLQKKYRQLVAEACFLESLVTPPLRKSIITGHETWVYERDIQASPEYLEGCVSNEPKPKTYTTLQK